MAIRERQHHTPLEPTLNRLRDVVARPASGIWIARLLLITLIGVPLWLALAQFTPLAVVPASAAPTLFSGERAMNDLNVIAQASRPMGSAAHAATEQYLIDRLTELGLQPQIQATTGVALAENGDVWAGSVRNIVARIPGTDNTRGILLAAHYDSVPTGPGAGDCGSCVATVLETVRA